MGNGECGIFRIPKSAFRNPQSKIQNPKSKITLVLGLGSILRGDDAFGVRVAEELRKRDLPANVRVIVAELRGLAYAEDIQRAERVIIADAIDAGKPAGALVVFTPEQVRSLDTDASPHGVGMLGILKLLQTLGPCPPVTIVGCQRGEAFEGEALSPEVAAAVTVAGDMIERLVRR